MSRKKLCNLVVAIALICTSFTMLFVTTPVRAAPTNYYVSKLGNDGNDGSAPDAAHAFLTIQHGVNAAMAGDIVYVRAGKYSELIKFPRDGTVGNWITLARYPADAPARVYIDGSGIVTPGDGLVTFGTAIGDNHGVSYIRIQNLTLENSTSRGIIARGTNGASKGHYIIDHCTIDRIATQGIMVGNFGDAFLNNITVQYSDLYWCNVTGDIAEVISFYNAVDFSIHDNYMSKGGGIFIDIANSSHNGLIYNNRINGILNPINSNSRGIYLDTGDLDGTMYNISIYNNTIWGDVTAALGMSHEWSPGGLFHNISWYNNVVNMTASISMAAVFFEYEGIPSGVMCRDISFFSNTIVARGTSSTYWAAFYCAWTNAMTLRFNVTNNIFVTTKYTYAMYFTAIAATGENVNVSNNLFYKTDGSARWSFDGVADGAIPSSIVTDDNPDFVALGTDYHLLVTSPAIGAGSASVPISAIDRAGNIRPIGMGYDIGAYEYYLYTPPVIPPVTPPVTNHTNDTGLRSLAITTTDFIKGGISSADLFYVSIPNNMTEDTSLSIPTTYTGKSWWFLTTIKTVSSVLVYGITPAYEFQQIATTGTLTTLKLDVTDIGDYEAFVVIPNPGYFQTSEWWFNFLNNANSIFTSGEALE